MAFVPTDNTARFELVYLHNGVYVENVFHVYSTVTNWTSSDLSNTCSDFKTWWNGYIKNIVSSDTSLVKIIATALHAQTSPKVEYVDGLPIDGLGTSPSMPGNVTLAVKWSTGNRGRSARGRTFHVGLMEEQCTGNLLDESIYTTMLTAYTALLTQINVSSKSLRILSLFHDGAARTAGLTTVITGCSINPTLDTQRRRLI